MTLSIGVGIGITQPRKYNPFVLDNLAVSALLGYGVRKLKKEYSGSCMRVRRSSDSLELNIGFDSTGGLDQTGLLAHVGSDSGFVTKWYQQVSGGADAIQETQALQPRIVNSGVLDTLNGKPCVKFLGTQYMLINQGAQVISNSFTNVVIGRSSGVGLVFTSADATSLLATINTSMGGSGARVRNDALNVGNLTATVPLGQVIIGSGWDSTVPQMVFYANGALSISGAGPTAPCTTSLASLGATVVGGPTIISAADYQELTFFTSFLSTPDRRALEQNQGAYYGVSIT